MSPLTHRDPLVYHRSSELCRIPPLIPIAIYHKRVAWQTNSSCIETATKKAKSAVGVGSEDANAKATDFTGKAKEKAHEAAGEAKGKAHETAGEVKGKINETKGKL